MGVPALAERCESIVASRREQGLLRQRQCLESPQGPRVDVDGRSYLCFCSNDYLGLASHPDVVAAMAEGARHFGAGSGASHLVVGHSSVHHELEQRLAQWTGRDRALLFSSGYMANLGVLTALLGNGDQVFEDRLNHASLLDGGLYSGARFQRFHHNDVNNLESRLEKAPATGLRVVVIDGVFSMDGDLAPLPELANCAGSHGAALMVDDAHGLGVLGPTGAGSTEHYGLGQSDVPVLIGTLGKALGTAGAFVAGSEQLIEAIIQLARSYIYTTALPPAVSAATLAAIELAREEDWRRKRLHTLIARFREGADSLGLELLPSGSPIQPILLGEPERAMRWSEQLRERGILISAIRPPTVPAGSSRLRLTFSASHETSDVDVLLDSLAELRD